MKLRISILLCILGLVLAGSSGLSSQPARGSTTPPVEATGSAEGQPADGKSAEAKSAAGSFLGDWPARLETFLGKLNPAPLLDRGPGLVEGIPLRVVGVIALFALGSVFVVIWLVSAFGSGARVKQTGSVLHPGLRMGVAGSAVLQATGSPRAGSVPSGAEPPVASGPRLADQRATDVHPAHESFVPELHQERWSLPGFLALYQPLRDLDLRPVSLLPEEVRAVPQSYRFEVRPDGSGGFADLHALVLGLFGRLARAEPEEQLIFLRNSAGGLFCYGRKRGEVLLREPLSALPEGPLLEELRGGGAIFSADGTALYVPLVSVAGFLGYYVFQARRPLFSQQLVELVWWETRRFSERALQGRLFDVIARDASSGLYSGALFHHDLVAAFRMAPVGSRELALLELPGIAEASWRAVGLVLSAGFTQHATYRIGQSLAALLGPTGTEATFGTTLAGVLAALQEGLEVTLSAGVASRDADMNTADDWFQAAARALAEATAVGPNHYRFRGPVGAHESAAR